MNRKSFKILSLTMRPGLLHSLPSQARTSPLSTLPSCNIRLSLANFLPKFSPLCKLAIRHRLRNMSLRSFPALPLLGSQEKPSTPGSQTPPDDGAIQELPRTTRDPLPAWVDQLNLKTAHLAALLSEAQDLLKSPKGWIKCSALCAYNGPSIPGNFVS